MHPVIQALISAVAVFSALLGALVTYLLARRRASDRSTLEVWRVAFDRPAFKGPYLLHSLPDPFREAIQLTIQCVNTGKLQNRKGIELAQTKPKAQIRNPELRAVAENLERKLIRLKLLIPDLGPPPNCETVDAIDKEREEIIDMLNVLWSRAKLPMLARPKDAGTMNDVFSE